MGSCFIYNSMKHDIDKFKVTAELYVKNCPDCDKNLEYTGKLARRNLLKSIREERRCQPCANKRRMNRLEEREANSARVAAWNASHREFVASNLARARSSANKRSKKETAVLDTIEEMCQVTLLRQHVIGVYSVDGYCESTKTVYEFNGCVFHGHECSTEFIKNNGGKIPLSNMTPGQKRHCDHIRTQYLMRSGHNVVTLWECEIVPKSEINHEALRQCLHHAGQLTRIANGE